MKLFRMTLFMLLLTSCNANIQKKEIKMNLNTQSFTEGTVGMIGEHKVMFSNIMIQDYTLEDGTGQEGPAASLSLPNTKEWVVVGAGSTFLLDGKKYEVFEITENDPFGEIIVKLHQNTQSFTEGTVGMIGEHKVMFSNIMIQDYKLEDGTTQEGPAASLSLPNTKEWVVVGAGSTFLLDGKKYVVVEITEDDPFGKIIVKI
jgi:uncharacterized protein YaiE (UPF0345 family)